jgi:RNA polymerase sigma factor (sigma-70 family)
VQEATKYKPGSYGRGGVPREIANRMYSDYCRLKSIAKAAKLWGCSRQSFWGVLTTQGYQLNAKKKLEVVSTNGAKYKLGPGGYLRRTDGNRPFLHRELWEQANGPVPPKHVVIFKDGDRTNCLLENLQCIPLTEQAKVQLAGRRYNNGSGIVVWEKLAKKHAGFIQKQAVKFAERWGMEFEDLYQEGMLALRRAMDDFDKKRGVGFLSFAGQYIKQQMRDYCFTHCSTIRIPQTVLKRKTKSISGITDEYPNGAPRLTFLSFDYSTQTSDGDSATLAEVLKDENAVPADEALITADTDIRTRAALKRAFAALPEREQYYLTRRFGLDGKPKATLQTLGNEEGVSNQVIAKRVSDILGKLAESLYAVTNL